MSLSRVRLILWLVVGAVALGMVMLIWRQSEQQQAASSPLGTVGGPFTLTGTDGRPFPSSRLNGRPAAIFFGFTHCPDVCPTTLARLAKLRRQLGQGDDALAIVFVTVDPERDTPAELGNYLTLYDTPVVGLTGSPAQIEQIKKQFGVYSRKVEQPGGGYSVDHTASVILLDRNGQFVATLSPEEGDQVALDKLKRITA
ncbi:MAG: SCO family protein [Pseudomonadota bacterium]|nr:SCO family protein [Pseudomonadota bacterium]